MPPLHFIKGGKGIDQIPFDATIGRARVLEMKDAESIKPAELVEYGIRRSERILFKTKNSAYVWQPDDRWWGYIFRRVMRHR